MIAISQFIINDKTLKTGNNFINGRPKATELIIIWQQTDGFEFEFEGTTDLSMSDFGIDSPSPPLNRAIEQNYISNV